MRLPREHWPVGPEQASAAPLPGSIPDEPAQPNTVLVIDDDPAQLEIMRRFLEREGFVARTASNGTAGLALARALHPRAILLDVTMPGVDGWTVLRMLKADPALAAIPVVMVTFIEDSGLATTLGAEDHVTKPVRWESFRGVMDRFRDTDGSVLVVDDNEDTRRQLRAMLEREGWLVTEAANGREALDSLTERRPRVVLLDLEMPVMDGFAFLEALRAMPDCREIPVIVVTARDLSTEDRDHLRGVSKVVNKGDGSLRGLSKDVSMLGGYP